MTDPLRISQPAHISKPEPGYYKRRLVRGGPFVPVRIVRFCMCTVGGGGDNARHVWDDRCDRYPPLTAVIDGALEEDALKHWVYCAGNPITRDEYDHMLSLRKWARSSAPDDPMGSPDKRIDPMKIASLF